MSEALDYLRYVFDPSGIRRRRILHMVAKQYIDEDFAKYFEQPPAIGEFQRGYFFDLVGLAIFIEHAPLSAFANTQLVTRSEVTHGVGTTTRADAEDLLRKSLLSVALKRLTDQPISVPMDIDE